MLKVVDRGIVKVERLTTDLEAHERARDLGEDAADANSRIGNTSDDNYNDSMPDERSDPPQDATSLPALPPGPETTPSAMPIPENDAVIESQSTPAFTFPGTLSLSSTGSVHESEAAPTRPDVAAPEDRPSETIRRSATSQSAGMSAVEAMLIRRHSASSSISTRPSKLSLVAAAAPHENSAETRPSASRMGRSQRSLGDEIASATATEVEEDVGNDSFKSVVEVSSLDPRAAARAAAILKMVGRFVLRRIQGQLANGRITRTLSMASCRLPPQLLPPATCHSRGPLGQVHPPYPVRLALRAAEDSSQSTLIRSIRPASSIARSCCTRLSWKSSLVAGVDLDPEQGVWGRLRAGTRPTRRSCRFPGDGR